MDIYLAPNGDRGPYRLIEGMAGVLAAGVVCYARFSPRSHRTKINVGVACLVPQAFALALLNSWVEQPTTMRPLSGITGLLLVFGMLAPAKPGKLLTAAVVAASMDPLGVWIAHLRGLPVPSVLSTFLMFHPNYVAAILTVAPAQILYRLGRQLREARALGSYQLIELLGKGGMGEVWLARHRLLARSAAIKLVRPDMLGGGSRDATAMTLGRFEREAQATAALTSPHTIRLYDFGLTDEGSFYYAMELLDGRDLESLVREFGPLPPERAMYLVRQVCRSLAEAHAIGLIHRDIKPANIYVCRMGLEYDFVKVLDFGLVTLDDRRGASGLVTAEHVAIGTPAYMAPEAILGEANVDHRADRVRAGLRRVLPADRRACLPCREPDETAHAARARRADSAFTSNGAGDSSRDRRPGVGLPAQRPESTSTQRRGTGSLGLRLQDGQCVGPAGGQEVVGGPSPATHDTGDGHHPRLGLGRSRSRNLVAQQGLPELCDSSTPPARPARKLS